MANTKIQSEQIEDDIALGGNPTTTTQSAGNNTTRVATTAFVTTAVANLVDSAPSALDTLNELAAAMGDDASFSTTITNSIATKLPLAGGTMTGNIAHASDFTIDAGGDITLDADGADIILKDGGTSFAELDKDNDNFRIKNPIADGDIKIQGVDGSSTITALDFDMSAAGAATFNSSAVFGGDITANTGGSATTIRLKNNVTGTGGTDGAVLQVDSNEFYVWNFENDDIVFGANNDEKVRIDGPTGNVGIGTSSPDSLLELETAVTNATGGLLLTNTNASGYSTVQFKNTGGTAQTYTMALGGSSSAFAQKLYIYDDTDSAARVVLDHAGNVGIGSSNPNTRLHIVGLNQTNGTLDLTPNAAKGSHSSFVHYGANGDWYIRSASASGNVNIQDTGGNLLVGTTASRSLSGVTPNLFKEGTGYNDSAMALVGNTGTSAATAPLLLFGRSRGTSNGASTSVASGDRLGGIFFTGADGTDIESLAAVIQAKVDGTPGSNDMPGRLEFYTTPDGSETTVERMRIHSGGVVSISGGVELGNGFAGAASNTLDDYEEGTFTGSGTAGSSTALTIDNEKYTKIGNQVTIVFTVNFSGASGGLSVTGLPFAAAEASVGIGREDATSGYAVYGRVGQSSSGISIYYAGATANASPFQVSAGNMRFSMTYLT